VSVELGLSPRGSRSISAAGKPAGGDGFAAKQRRTPAQFVPGSRRQISRGWRPWAGPGGELGARQGNDGGGGATLRARPPRHDCWWTTDRGWGVAGALRAAIVLSCWGSPARVRWVFRVGRSVCMGALYGALNVGLRAMEALPGVAARAEGFALMARPIACGSMAPGGLLEAIRFSFSGGAMQEKAQRGNAGATVDVIRFPAGEAWGLSIATRRRTACQRAWGQRCGPWAVKTSANSFRLAAAWRRWPASALQVAA